MSRLVRRRIALLAVAVVVSAPAAVAAPATPPAARVEVQEYRLPDATMDALRQDFFRHVESRYGAGSWAPLRFDLSDEHLALMGLPSADVLRSRSYAKPTMVSPRGTFTEVALPTVATYAGTGYFGIRPGAFLLTITDDSIGWCSAAHVYGTPGTYGISTAGHCGAVDQTATVIAGFGNARGALNPILLDFGTYATSRTGGLGNDYAMIDIRPAWQSLVTPTMAFWGGPRGVFTRSGSVAGMTIPDDDPIPRVRVNPDPNLAQTIVHYGHGTGVGAGGTPRAGSALFWGSTTFMFFGAISPGDSGSGANTLLGDTAGATMEAAGIITHLYVDPLMRRGIGVMGGTRSTVFAGAPAAGQLVSYPVPAPLLP